MLLTDLIADYLVTTQERGFAVSTRFAYTSWLHHFTKWLTENGYPEPDHTVLCVPVLRRFLYYCLTERKHRPRTVRGAFLPIQGLCKHLVTHGLLTTNPMDSLTLPKKDAAQRLTVSNQEVQDLLAACERLRSPKRVALARAILQTFLSGALRRQELLDLHLADVDTTAGKVLVRMGKGGKSRTLYLSEDWKAALREWLTFRPKDTEIPHLFLSDRSRRLHEIGMVNLLEEVKAIAGYRNAPNIKPHSLRHWRATDLLRSGANLRDIQTFLGHASLQVTSVYLHTSEEQCRGLAELSTLTKKEAPPPVKETGPVRRRVNLR